MLPRCRTGEARLHAASSPEVELVERYRGFEICRTTAGHLVVLDPRDSEEERGALTELLANAGALDALFFPSVEEAHEVIGLFIANGLTHGGRPPEAT